MPPSPFDPSNNPTPPPHTPPRHGHSPRAAANDWGPPQTGPKASGITYALLEPYLEELANQFTIQADPHGAWVYATDPNNDGTQSGLAGWKRIELQEIHHNSFMLPLSLNWQITFESSPPCNAGLSRLRLSECMARDLNGGLDGDLTLERFQLWVHDYAIGYWNRWPRLIEETGLSADDVLNRIALVLDAEREQVAT